MPSHLLLRGFQAGGIYEQDGWWRARNPKNSSENSLTIEINKGSIGITEEFRSCLACNNSNNVSYLKKFKEGEIFFLKMVWAHPFSDISERRECSWLLKMYVHLYPCQNAFFQYKMLKYSSKLTGNEQSGQLAGPFTPLQDKNPRQRNQQLFYRHLCRTR